MTDERCIIPPCRNCGCHPLDHPASNMPLPFAMSCHCGACPGYEAVMADDALIAATGNVDRKSWKPGDPEISISFNS